MSKALIHPALPSSLEEHHPVKALVSVSVSLSTAFQALGILVIFVPILGTSNCPHPTYLQLSFQTIKQRHFGSHLEKLKTKMENMQNLIKGCSPVNYINFNFLVVHDHIRRQQWERGWMKGIWRLFFAIFTTLLN